MYEWVLFFDRFKKCLKGCQTHSCETALRTMFALIPSGSCRASCLSLTHFFSALFIKFYVNVTTKTMEKKSLSHCNSGDSRTYGNTWFSEKVEKKSNIKTEAKGLSLGD